MLLLPEEISITDGLLKSIVNDPEKTAHAINLQYVSDAQPGIRRIKKGRSFKYVYGEKKVSDGRMLERIKKLVIPPAWENVWICRHENGHLQATGLDLKKRKQYRYHTLWSSMRNQTKFYRLYEFGKHVPAIRKQIDRDLSLKGMPLEKVLAAVVALMEETSIRVGSNLYEKLYGSFGLTTLKDNHVKISGSQLTFMFTGKKGIAHRISLKSKKLAHIVQKCKDIPGKELFQYFDDDGQRRQIDSGMVNDYIQKISCCDYSAKDFRTWKGTVHALIAFKELGPAENATQCKKNIVAALDEVATQLGNTRTVCRKYYVHPVITELYENQRLFQYLSDLGNSGKCNRHDLTCEEKVLMKILRKEARSIK
jgi:DNA topoisomerase I